MLESMTGFGRSEKSNDHGTVLVEVRCVNGRYLKVHVRAPDLLLGHEGEIEQRVKGRMQRGTVSVAIHLKTSSSAGAWRINDEALRQYAASLKALAVELGAAGGVSLDTLAALPGAVEPAEPSDLDAAVWPLTCDALDEALVALVAMRRTEGEALTQALLGHVDEIARVVESVAERAPDVVAEYRDRLVARVQDLVSQAGLTVTEADLVREVAVFAERSDIAEEINRLRSHVEQFRAMAAADQPGNADKPPGRTLDFLIQEMQREANTIAAKANDLSIAHQVVGLKGEIDRMKEQIQNIA